MWSARSAASSRRSVARASPHAERPPADELKRIDERTIESLQERARQLCCLGAEPEPKRKFAHLIRLQTGGRIRPPGADTQIVAKNVAAGTARIGRHSLRWRLPALIAAGIGLTLINSRGVIEALFGVKSAFVRTPKYAIEGTQQKRMAVKKYQRKSGWLPWLEICAGGPAALR